MVFRRYFDEVIAVQSGRLAIAVFGAGEDSMFNKTATALGKNIIWGGIINRPKQITYFRRSARAVLLVLLLVSKYRAS